MTGCAGWPRRRGTTSTGWTATGRCCTPCVARSPPGDPAGATEGPMSTSGDMGTRPTSRDRGTRRRQRVLVPGLVFVATVVALVSSLGAPLVPRIAEVRDVPVGDAQWSLTITLLVGAVATP